MSKRIDPRSAEPVLTYRPGKRTPSEVPARDLSGNDLARIAYIRAVQKQVDDRDVRRPQVGGKEPAEPKRPKAASAAQLADLATELVDSGAFTAATKPSTRKPTPTRAAPAAATKPEA